MAISIGQLDLEALKNYLKIVQGFRTVNDPSIDTENVDGVAAGLIAIASLIDGELIKDENGNGRRDVVNNALNLLRIDEFGGQTIITADDVLTEDEGQSLKDVSIKAAKNTAEDMRQLRNEMYHLKTKMIKSGAITFDQVYNGWIDPFINYIEDADPMSGRFTKDAYPCQGINNFVRVDCPTETYRVGQGAVLLSKDGEAIFADTITSIDKDSEFVLGEGSRFVDTTPEVIQKSYGLYHKGQFIFANNVADLTSTDKSVNMIYKDGPSRIKVFEINNPEYIIGFCTTIEVPAELDENYLNAIGLSLRAVGKPYGQIWCELYHYNNENIYNPSEVIASSEFLNSDTITSAWKTHKFFFRDSDIKLESGHRYLLMIKGTVSDPNNVWCIGGFEEDCNMEVHKDTFIYRQGDVVLEPIAPVTNTNKIYDAFISLYTTETQQITLNYSRYGAYTGTFQLEHAEASRVRVSFNPNTNKIPVEDFFNNIDNYYTVSVKGQTIEGEYVDGEFEGKKELSHVVISNGEVSANEFVYDFAFKKIGVDDIVRPVSVVKIEFQIMYHSPDPVSNERHGSLFSVVVSTDNAYLGGEE